MSFPQSGGCQCGAIRYEIGGPPAVVYACHCTECQRQSGSAFAMAAVIPQQHFRITEGNPKMFARKTGPSKTMECWFCPDCGTRLYHVPGGAAYANRNIKRARWMIGRGWSRPFIFGRAARKRGSSY